MTILSNGHRLTRYFDLRYEDIKSVIDLLIAILIVLMLSPLFVLIALCVMIDSPGGALFKQERVGKLGKKFVMYKFRSMHGKTDDDEYKELLEELIKADASHMTYKLKFQPRVTRIGRFLRRTNLDELPQLFNVIKGELSLVGPRPDLPYSVAAYEDWMNKRLIVKPGMTGLWQVSGGNNLSFSEMLSLDIEYIKRQSPLLDAKILFLTMGTFLPKKYSEPEKKET